MGNEGTRRRSARNAVHHRSLNLEIIALIEKLAQRLHYRGAGTKYPSGIFVHDQINVALAITNLLIGKAMKLFG